MLDVTPRNQAPIARERSSEAVGKSVTLDVHAPRRDIDTTRSTIECVLLDPSLFTAPYDAALTQGLTQSGVNPVWATREVRPGDRPEIPGRFVEALFYKHVDHAPALPPPIRAVLKGLSHAVGLMRLLRLIRWRKPDVVHVQWTVLPLLDVMAMWIIRRKRPIVLTVHDPVPFNGERISLASRLGFDVPIKLATRVIVHTRAGRDLLVARGINPFKIAVIPHGPLQLHAAPRSATTTRDGRYTLVLFGEIKPYKGLDLLVEAIHRLPSELRDRTRVLVAGRPRMDIEPILARVRELNLEPVISIDPRRLSEDEMADLFAAADCFVFPYRFIDASGVYFLTKSLRKWMIAARVGVFAEELKDERTGELFEVEDVAGLTAAIATAIVERPQPPVASTRSSWSAIGEQTADLYRKAIAEHAR